MPVAVDIIINKRQWRRLQKTLWSIPKGLPRILVRAINAAIASISNLPSAAGAYVRTGRWKSLQMEEWPRVNVIEAATVNRPRAVATIRNPRIPLIAFDARETPAGVSYKISADGRKTLPGAFIARMPRGYEGVFVRTGTARLPIAEKFGPAMMDEESVAALQNKMAEQLGRDIEKQVEAIL